MLRSLVGSEMCIRDSMWCRTSRIPYIVDPRNGNVFISIGLAHAVCVFPWFQAVRTSKAPYIVSPRIWNVRISIGSGYIRTRCLLVSFHQKSLVLGTSGPGCRSLVVATKSLIFQYYYRQSRFPPPNNALYCRSADLECAYFHWFWAHRIPADRQYKALLGGDNRDCL